MSKLTHFNEQGRAKMVDVSDKAVTVRVAIAKSSIIVNKDHSLSNYRRYE